MAFLISEKNKSKDCNSTVELARVQGEKRAGVDIGEDIVNSGAGFGGDSADGRPLSTTWGTQSCSKLEADKQDSSSTGE
jgi:hypothetical protein